MERNSWLSFPFAEQILVAIVVLSLAPAMIGIFILYNDNVMFGMRMLVGWFCLFLPFTIFLDRRKIIRLLISLPGAALVLIAFWTIVKK